MKGKAQFSQAEIEEISSLIEQKLGAGTEEQKNIRDKIRALGFYASDFGIGGGYTVEDFKSVINTMEDTDAIHADLIRKYKVVLKEQKLKDEIYKWVLLGEFKGRPNIEAKNFADEIKSVNFDNLLFHNAIGVARHLAKDRPEEYRGCFKKLFNESIPLEKRIAEFSADTLKIYRQLEPIEAHSHHQDERTMATFLTYHNPEKYAFYKDSFYQKYCKRLWIASKGKGKKYVHYLQLLEQFRTSFIDTDEELLSSVNALIPDKAFKDPSHTLLAQDILYTVLDKGQEEIDIEDASVFKISMGSFSNEEMEECLKNNEILVHRDTRGKGTSSESQADSFRNMQIGDYFYLAQGNVPKGMKLLGRVTSDCSETDSKFVDVDGWLKRKFEIVANSINQTPYKGASKWWTPNNNSTCIRIERDELDEANKVLFEPYFNTRLISTKEDTTMVADHIPKYQKATTSMPLNQILYGPPGTGKTFSTIEKALRIINGAAERNLNWNDRAAVKAQFSKRLEDGKITFVTFHQSMSYEDFIEGIKPSTIKDQVVYETKEGIFKSICNRARVTSGNFDTVIEKFKKSISEEDGKPPLTIKAQTTSFDITYRGTSVFYIQPHNTTKEDPWYPINIENIRKAFEKESYENIYNPTYVREVIAHMTKSLGLVRGSREYASKSNYVLIIDEINRGNVSQIFGELITLIEEDKREGRAEELSAKLSYSKEPFSVPDNLYILGTMNTADRSVEALDTALRRRFSFIEMPPAYDLSQLEKEVAGFTARDILLKLNTRLEKLLDKDHLIGHSYFIDLDGDLSMLRNAFQHKIIPLLQEYFYGDIGKIGLVLGKGFFEVPSAANETSFADFEYESSGLENKRIYRLINVADEDKLSDDDFRTAVATLMK